MTPFILAKNSQKTFIASLALLIILATLVFTYILMAANIISSGYSLDKFENRVNALKKERNILLIELSQTSALNNVLERSSGLSFTEIEKVSYIKKTSNSPFAVR